MHISSILTAREQEVHGEIVEGKSNREIARDLRIAHSTVQNHVHNILTKLGIPSRIDLIVNHYKSIIEMMTVHETDCEE